ncbi:MAG: flagellar biosynthetic protein FliP, partial [Candidatus Methylumidiphilus sp.]
MASADSLFLPGFTSKPLPDGGQSFSLPLETLLLLTSLSFLPTALMVMTSFTRIVIVLSFLRQALGTQSAPPNQVLVGLAFFLTLFVMGPIFEQMYQDGVKPYSESKISFMEAVEKGGGPLKD